MIVKINNAVVSPKGEVIYERNGKDEREKGSFTLKTERKSRFETYDQVDITTPYKTEQFLVLSDNVEQQKNNLYEHKLEIVENIAKFDAIFPADRSFRKLNQTLEEILTVYKRELLAYHNISIDWDLSTEALNTVVPFKEFANGLNFSQIMQNLFFVIRAIPKVNRVLNTWQIYAQDISEKNNQISSYTKSLIFSQNNIGYGTRVKTQMKNAVNENNSTWYPSENGFILPRTSSLQRIQSNLRYELDSPIIFIEQAIVPGVQIFADNSGGIEEEFNVDLDITSQVVPEEVYDTLPTIVALDDTNASLSGDSIVNSNNAKNNVRYRPRERYITGIYESDTTQIIFSSATNFLRNAIRRVAKLYIESLGTYTNIRVVDFADTTEIPMRFKYIRQRDIDLVHSRKTKGAMNDSTLMHNQRDASIEAGQYLKNLKFYSNRVGNNVYSRAKEFVNTEPYDVFDYTEDNEIATNIRYIWHSDNHVTCEFETSENFANIEAEYALKRTTDPYTITGKSVTTNLVAEEFIEFSEVNRTDDSRLTDDGKRLSLGLFESNLVGNAPLEVGVFKPVLASWDDTKAIRMPVEITANGNAMSFHVYFDHPTIAAKTYYDLENNTYQDYLNPLPYTEIDEDNNILGTLTNFELYFTEGVEFLDSGQYPLLLTETSHLVNNLTENGVVEPIDLDSNAAFAYTYVISFVADEWIYIGEKLSKDNYLFSDTQSATAPKVYSSTKPYGQFDQVPRSYDTDVSASVSYTYNSTTREFTISPSIDLDYFSIVKDGEILLAFNRSLTSGQTYKVYVNYLSFLVEVASVELEYILDSSGLLDYIVQETLLFNAENILTGSGLMTYIVKATNALELNNTLQQSGSMEYTIFADLIIEQETTLQQSGLLNYTLIGDIALTKEFILQSTGELTYQVNPNFDGTFETTLASSGVLDYTSLPDPSPVEWVIISSGTPTGGNCQFVSDVGNIKTEQVTVCEFNQVSSYTSSVDESTSQPACKDGATYTRCLPNPQNPSEYICTVFEGSDGQETIYYECKLK